MTLEKPLDAVEGLVEDGDVCKVHNPDMTGSLLNTESTPMDEQDVLFFEQPQHELLVVLSPSRVRQPYEHVERASWRLHLEPFDGVDALQTTVPLAPNAIDVPPHPRPVALQASKETALRRGGSTKA